MQSPVEPRKRRQIPPEVVDFIIDHCYDQTKTLHTCSLVCKGWLSSSRYHLFSTITLDDGNVPSFVALLESPSGPSICPLVTQLVLNIEHDIGLIQSIPALSSYLRPVSLKLIILREINSEPVDLSTLIPAFQTVTSLDIFMAYDTFIEIARILAIITSFPLLRHLVFQGVCNHESEIEFPLGEFAPPSHLHTLKFYGAMFFFRWLLSHSPVPRLSTLGLAITSTRDLGLIRRYLPEFNETLRHLSIHGDSDVLSSDDMDLRYLSHLRTIHIRVANNIISTILHLLSRVNSMSIEVIRFWVWGSTNDPPMLWDELDVLLASPRFPRLLRVTVDVEPRHHTGVKSRLGCINSRKMLHFRGAPL